MRYTTFGRTSGLRVSEYALGTANFGTLWGGGASREEARKIFDRFAEAGGTFVDTADNYQIGESEKLLGEFLLTDRDHFVVATKFTLGAGRARVSETGNSRKNIRRSVEASLKRLGTDHIDLYWAHLPDSVTPVEEILSALDDLIHAGKILHAGLSNFPAWRVSRAATIAELRGLTRLAGVQFEYSLAERGADRELLPMAEALGLGTALWSPLGGGLLTGKYRQSPDGRLSDWEGQAIRVEDSEQRTSTVDTLLAVAEECDASAAQVAVAWLRERAARTATTMVPVIGPRTVDQLEQYLGALQLELDDAQFDRLEAVSALRPGQPYELISGHRDAALGGESARFLSHPVPVA
ncbi:aldo/keto reductase [Streptomyces alkaliterrae]|uniref:Aldo/keto reductase n=1 Tax=Streptomyces alkaliterrae TaxID=2213162 RepID=A0A5P0YJJ0_9ACTN|nr:aldo/keto reductase [Streptomyces alkaliterrae]MBB1258101.1 aldo/keto reductase [Streptomyces alkaliterrae]MQS00543.1 aldo/keto reductase [Streptomyces alkaliterrae]